MSSRQQPSQAEEPTQEDSTFRPYNHAASKKDLESSKFYQKIDRKIFTAHDSHHHKNSHWLVDSLWFNLLVGTLVVLNAIVLGFETDFPHNEEVWTVFENVFTGLFLLELILKLVCLRHLYFFDIANWLDAVIVVVSVVDCWLSLLIPSTAPGGKLKNFQVLRVLRMVRIVRVMRILRYCRKLVLVVRGVIKAIETTFWVACVLLVFVYCCAIFTTEFLGRGTETLYPAYSEDDVTIDEQEIMQNFNPYLCFGGMLRSMFTLFNVAIMSEWTEVVRPVAIKQPSMMVFFISFALFVTFGIMNVIVAMIVDNVLQEKSNLEAEDKKQQSQRKKEQWLQLVGLIKGMENEDHVIPVERLRSVMEEQELFRYTYEEYLTDKSFLKRLETARSERKIDFQDWQAYLDIRDNVGDKVDLFEKGSLLESFKKGLPGPFFKDALAKVQKDRFPLTVKLQDKESHAFNTLLSRCNFPEGLSAEELMMMFDSSGDGMLQHHEFLTNFYRIIEGDELQQISLLQAGINRVKFVLQQKVERILSEVQELRSLVLSQKRTSDFDQCTTTCLASLIQENQRITENRLQCFEERVLRALNAPLPCNQEVNQTAIRGDMMELENRNVDARVLTAPHCNNLANKLGNDCMSSSCKDVEASCMASCKNVSCTEPVKGNQNFSSPSKNEFDYPNAEQYFGHGDGSSFQDIVTWPNQKITRNGTSLDYVSAPTVCVTSPGDNRIAAPTGEDNFNFEVVVQDGCSLGCKVSWQGQCPQITEVDSEARWGIRAGDWIVECEGASTCGRSREELLKVIKTTRPLHLTFCRMV